MHTDPAAAITDAPEPPPATLLDSLHGTEALDAGIDTAGPQHYVIAGADWWHFRDPYFGVEVLQHQRPARHPRQVLSVLVLPPYGVTWHSRHVDADGATSLVFLRDPSELTAMPMTPAGVVDACAEALAFEPLRYRLPGSDVTWRGVPSHDGASWYGTVAGTPVQVESNGVDRWVAKLLWTHGQTGLRQLERSINSSPDGRLAAPNPRLAAPTLDACLAAAERWPTGVLRAATALALEGGEGARGTMPATADMPFHASVITAGNAVAMALLELLPPQDAPTAPASERELADRAYSSLLAWIDACQRLAAAGDTSDSGWSTEALVANAPERLIRSR